MRFKDVQCVYCNNTFDENSDVVVCPQCGSPHHRDCWNEKGSCANQERHSEGFSWEFPSHLKPAIPLKKPRPLSNETAYKFKNGESAVTCPHCGCLNYGFDAVCMQCKKPLDDNRVAAPDNSIENQLSGEQLFEYYRQYGGIKPETEIGGIAAGDYAAYIGKNSGRYIRKFAVMERFGKKFTVSLCAFLFGPVWFLYRKLYKEGILLLLATLILTCAGTYCSLTEPMKEYLNDSSAIIAESMEATTDAMNFDAAAIEEINVKLEELALTYEQQELSREDQIKSVCGMILSYVNLSLSFVMGLCADTLYRKKIIKDITALRQTHKDSPELYISALRKKGGVFPAGTAIGIISLIAIYFINFIPSFLALAEKLNIL